MRYIGFDMGDGESAVAAFEQGSGIEPIILPVCGARSLLSAVGMRNGEILIGESAYTDALAEGLSVRFKSRFTTDPACYEDVVRFVRGVLNDLRDGGRLAADDRFVVGCPAGWNAACRARYRDLLVRAGISAPQVISESRAAFLYAKYARTIAMDVDVLNESALVVDIGSSTLDFAYIVDGRETGVGTFGDTSLGGGILDAALLRRAVERCRERAAIRAVFSECRSWYSYCEIEARRVKEEYFTRLVDEAAPVVKKQVRVCYDGVQKLDLQLDNEEASHLVDEPLQELDGRTFAGAVREALENAARVTADRPPRLLLLTGGASRMPFFRELCSEIFETAIVISCPEPEFSIAKGLAYAGWIDENLRAFSEAIRTEITDERVSAIVHEAMPSLLPAVADSLVTLLLEEAAIPISQQWKNGDIATLQEMNDQIARRAERVLASPLAEEALAPVIRAWIAGLTDRLQSMVDPICDRYDVPRKQMRLNLTATGAGNVSVDAAGFVGLNLVGALLVVILSVLTGLLCGGEGIALVAAGPLGFLTGAVIGIIASLLGWGAVSHALLKAKIPPLLRRVNIEKRLRADSTRQKLRESMLNSLAGENSAFQKQVSEGFSKSFRGYVYSIAQAAEIPIE
ncbi:MAG: Hsp70 family protein [Clostridiales bacterium]|nr:Hsp70 family protein [Clostridiales bacterium]